MRKLFAHLMAVLFVSCGFSFGQDLNDGLVAYYPFNGNANDESGNGNHFTEEGSPTYVKGISGNAILFDGIDDLVITDRLVSANGYTWTGWFKILDDAILMSQADASVRISPTFIHNSNGQITFSNYTGSGHIVEYRDEDLSVNEWRSISAVVSDNGSKKLYINGELKAENSSARSFGEQNAKFVMGGDYRAPRNYQNLQADEVRIYNRALSGDEIASLYALDSKTLPSFQVIEGNFTWHEAKADAEAKGGRLAVLDTQAKIDASNAYLQELGEWPYLWLGLTDEVQEGDWRWITGEALSAENWHSLEPNDGGRGNYAQIFSSPRKLGLTWNDAPGNEEIAYLLEILDQTPAAPFIALDPLYESPSGEAITIDATPTVGFPTEFTYQWCFNGFKIPAALGGAAETINIDNLTANEGTWSVTVTNETGSTESSFEYRLYADSDSDGLSDAYEELISETDINKPDTDDDGLSDGDEVNTYSTNPTLADTDSDGFDDLFEISTGFDPVSDISSPQAYSQILLAAEFRFNAATGVSYRIESSSDLENWEVIETGIIGAGARVTRFYTIEGTTQRFYRAGRE
ncbi:hypothetical protein N9191_01835 [bacterium]|nr:hypothetical protein [bacterium]